jgi:myo-inositol-1(or 4)-monophosphatase
MMDRASQVAAAARENLEVELKLDGSIVTNADRAVEEFFRAELPKRWPGATIWGEEYGREEPSPEGIWLIDPVDGTSNFAYGSPLWGISVALAVDNVLSLGAVWLPDLQEFYIAEPGGAWVNGRPMAQIPVGPIEAHHLVSYHDGIYRRYANQRMPGKMRCAGAFVIDGAFTARQRYRGLIGRGEFLYDAAASILINQELGADIRWANGAPLNYADLIAGRAFDKAWLIFPRDSGFFLEDPT